MRKERCVMPDKRSLALLDSINDACSSSGYKVFSVEELVSAFPVVYGMDKEGVAECLKTLSEHDYVSVKYMDGESVCACPTSRGRLVKENKIEREIEKAQMSGRYFLYAFLGAFTGGLVAALIGCALKLAFGAA